MFFKHTNNFFQKKNIKHYNKKNLNKKVKTEAQFHVKQECFLKKNIYINLILNNISKNENKIILKKNSITSINFYNNTNFYLINTIVNKNLVKIKQNIYLYLTILKNLKNDLKKLYIYNYYKTYKNVYISNFIFKSFLIKITEYNNNLFTFNNNKRIIKFNNNFIFSDFNYILNKKIFLFQVLKYIINNNILLKNNKINTNSYYLLFFH